MDKTTAILVALGIAALVILAFFAVFRHRGKFKIKGPLVEFSAEGENSLPPVASATADRQIAKGSMTVEGISLAMPSFPRYFCQIRIHNRTSNTADNVRVELTEMESSTEEGERYLLPYLPLVLLPAEVTDKPSINPGGNLAFNLFNVTKQQVAHAPNLHVLIHYVSAKFAVGADEEKSTLFGKLALFYNNRNYRLKIKVTARDFSPTESELNLNFTGEGSRCRFTLMGLL